MDLAQRAKDLAHRAHAGQVDKAGRPYIEHVARVAAAVADDPEAEAVAWLHDVLEDGDTDHGNAAMQFPDRIKYAVTLLTRCTDYDMAIYYGEIRQNHLALRVKLADIADNADESRLALLDEKTASRLRRKYARAIAALTGPNAD
jgi:(p)ppGpp synthase/HD superfamily hydrolase